MEHEHPVSMTARAAKKALPERVGITKDARAMMNSAASMFTLYLTTMAHDASVKGKRSTITLKDVLSALRETELEHFIEPVEACLQDTKAVDARKRALREAQAASADGVDATGDQQQVLDEDAPMETDADLDAEQTMAEDTMAEDTMAEEDTADEAMDEGKDVDEDQAEDDKEPSVTGNGEQVPASSTDRGIVLEKDTTAEDEETTAEHS